MPSSRPRGSSGGANTAPRVSTAPMSERQQMALVMQLTSQSNHPGGSSTPTSQPPAKSRDRNERGETTLHIASIKGDIDQVKKLIEAGGDPSIPDYAGWTPLHEACNQGWYQVVHVLLEAGADVNALSIDNETPLHDAAGSGDLDCVKLLLEYGADPKFKNVKGKMPFDVACSPAYEYLGSLRESTSQRNQHSGKSRDDNKKNTTGDDSSSAGCSSAMMDPTKSSDDKNDSKDTPGSSDKPTVGQGNQKNDDNAAASNIATSTSNQEDTPSTNNQGTKRNFTETAEPTEAVVPEEEGTKRKKRKDSDSSKESKSNQQSRGNAGRNGINAGCKPPGPASKTGVAPLSKGGQSQGTGKSGGNAQNKGHGQGNQGKNAGNSGCKASGNQNSAQSGKLGSGNQKSQSGLSAGQNAKGMTDKKSPCASPKPPVFSQNKEDADADDNKTVDTPGPKVPPLKIVIPGGVGGAGGSGNQQEGDGGSTQRGSTKNRGGSSTLPYILQTSDNQSAEGNESTENAKDEKRQSSNTDDKPGVPGQRVLRSHRNADGGEKDKERGRNSPHVSNSACNPSTSGKSHHANQQSNDNNENNSNSANAGASGSGGSSSGSGASAGSSGQSSGNSGNSQAVWDGVFQVPSVDFHPRKRKIKSSKESHSHHQSSSDSAHGSGAGESHSININPAFNSYQMHINVKKQIERRLKGLFPVQPKPPQGFKDYLMNRCSYVLKNNAKQQPVLKPPQTVAPQMREEFMDQENERHTLRVQHLVEKEKLVLAVEQEILRVHGRAARALANQALPFSVCSVLKDKEVYNMLTPEQEEKERNAQRSRYNGRLFLSWLQDVDDKWEKIKESMVKRHHTEAQSLYATQSMCWTWRLEELGLCDHKTTTQFLEQGHVPKVNVSDDFDLLPA